MTGEKAGGPFWPEKIISGGQTGVDRAAFEVAIELGIDHGGWCPAGRLAEDGMIPSRYQVTELPGGGYSDRTEQNVIDSDATLILHGGKLKGGTLLTQRMAQRHAKPCLAVSVATTSPDQIRRWLGIHRPPRLNIAGPRESGLPGIEASSTALLHRVFCQ